MQCSKCRREAVIFQRYSGLHLCERHFLASVEARTKRTIRQHGWVKSGDRIGIALSGGKDSAALMHFFATTFGDRRDLDFLAITIDEGIAGYRDVSQAAEIARRYGIPSTTASFVAEYATTIDDIVSRRGDRQSCSWCGVLRRRLLNRVAREAGCTKVAFGFTLDDEAQSVLMNVLRGDADRLTMSPKPAEGMVPRIRPFEGVPEREVALYSHLTVGLLPDKGCPYSHNALRGDVRRLLDDYSWLHPSTKYALLGLRDDLAGCGEGTTMTTTICSECGEPTFGPCQSCAILREVTRE